MPDWPFARGDLWILRYRGTEIDDGSVAVGPPYEAGLDPWVNGEAINGQDVRDLVCRTLTANVAHERPGEFRHGVGPDLKLSEVVIRFRTCRPAVVVMVFQYWGLRTPQLGIDGAYTKPERNFGGACLRQRAIGLNGSWRALVRCRAPEMRSAKKNSKPCVVPIAN